MKKLLLTFDGQHFSEGVYNFAYELNKQEPVLATGVFLPVVDHTELLYSLGTVSGPLFAQEMLEDDTRAIKLNVAKFKALCQHDKMLYRVHTNVSSGVVQNLKHESRYADLLLLSSERFYENLGEDSQEVYIIRTAHKIECPLLLVPEKYSFPKSLILTYDGSEDSVYAIKQFAYLFPQYTGLKTILVHASTGRQIPDIRLIKEFAECHFKDIHFFKLNADPQKYFDTWLIDSKDTLLVAGAWGRSVLSELIKKSFVMEAVRQHRMPIFIAHR